MVMKRRLPGESLVAVVVPAAAVVRLGGLALAPGGGGNDGATRLGAVVVVERPIGRLAVVVLVDDVDVDGEVRSAAVRVVVRRQVGGTGAAGEVGGAGRLVRQRPVLVTPSVLEDGAAVGGQYDLRLGAGGRRHGRRRCRGGRGGGSGRRRGGGARHRTRHRGGRRRRDLSWHREREICEQTHFLICNKALNLDLLFDFTKLNTFYLSSLIKIN